MTTENQTTNQSGSTVTVGSSTVTVGSSTVTIGVTEWGTPKPSRKQFAPREELPRLPFTKLADGDNNVLRLLTKPFRYYQARWQAPNSKKAFGDRIRTAWPTYADECPVKNDLQLKPTERYMAIVLNRKTKIIELFDMSSSVKEGVEAALASKRSELRDEGENDKADKVTPLDFDIQVKMDKNAPPANFYNVQSRSIKSLTEAEWRLINEVDGGLETFDKILARQTACPRPDTVRKRLVDLGWVPGQVAVVAETSAVAELAPPAEDDFKFEK